MIHQFSLKTAFVSLSTCLALSTAQTVRSENKPPSPGKNALSTSPVCNRVRFFPAPGAEQALVGGRIEGSNFSFKEGFEVLAEIKTAPKSGEWGELSFDNHKVYRWLRYEGPSGSYGRIAEIEFYNGNKKVTDHDAIPFGSIVPLPVDDWKQGPDGSFTPVPAPMDQLPDGTKVFPHHSHAQAFDGKTDTWFESDAPDHQCVGMDLRDYGSTWRPRLEPAPGDFDKPVDVTIRSQSGATIRYTLDGSMPTMEHGLTYAAPIHLEKNTTFVAVAFLDKGAPSPPYSGTYLFDSCSKPGLATLHIGNSLTGNTHAFGEYARSAGYRHTYKSFLMPGALTKKLWDIGLTNEKDKGNWQKAWDSLPKVDMLTVQPRDFTVAEEAEYEIRFFNLVRQKSPDMQPWLFVEWAELKSGRPTDNGLVASSQMKTLFPALTWEERMSAMVLYVEEVQHKINETYKGGKRPRVLPSALALGWFKNMIDNGKVPGLAHGSFHSMLFMDHVHLADSAVIHGSSNGACLVDMTWFSAFYGQSPEGTVLPIETFFTPEQAGILQRLAWDVIKNYPDCGYYEEGSTPVGKPGFSPAPTTVKGVTPVTLTSSTPGAWFRYTLDGTEPARTRGCIYCGVISVRPGMTVKAIAYKSGMADSPVVAATY